MSPRGAVHPVLQLHGSEVLEDVQVKPGRERVGANRQGAVVNMSAAPEATTSTGTPRWWCSERRWSTTTTPGNDGRRSDAAADVSFGGPLKRDRMWFFGTYRRTWIENGVSRTPAQLSMLQALVPGFEPTDSPTTVNAAFGKVTAQLAPDQQFMLFVDYNRQKAEPVAATYERAFGTSSRAGHRSAPATRPTSAARRLKVGATYNDLGNPSELRSWTTPARNVFARVIQSGGRLVGSTLVANLDNTTVAQEAPSDKLTFTADFNYYRSGWLGSHDIQTGVYLQPRRLAEFNARYTVGPDGVTLENHVLVDPDNPAHIPSSGSFTTPPFVFRSIRVRLRLYVRTVRPSARLT